MASTTLIIFAKLPRLGQVKTRLQGLLGEQGCLALHYSLIDHALELSSSWNEGPVELWFSERPEVNEFQMAISERIELPESIQLRYQKGDNLGQRMQQALQSAIECHDRAVLIGTDCPQQQLSHLNQANKVLQQGTDVVVQPAYDGGFVLIGCSKKVPDLSGAIQWGNGSVMSQLEIELERQHLSLGKTETISDLDEEKDFLLLQEDKSLFLSKFYIRFEALKKS